MKPFPEWKAQRAKLFYVVRGLPGSGKSSKVEEVLKEHGVGHDCVFSTDDFWTKDSEDSCIEEYKLNFNPTRLPEAHGWNFERCKKALEVGLSPVILDNTNVKKECYLGYVEQARTNGYEVQVIEPDSSWWKAYRFYLRPANKRLDKLEEFSHILAEKNEHGVPYDVIETMAVAWED